MARETTLPILAQIALNKGLVTREDVDSVLAQRVYNPNLPFHHALSRLPNLELKQVEGLIAEFLKDDKRYLSLIQSLGLITQDELDEAIAQQDEQAARGILIRASSVLERRGIDVVIGGYRLVECLGSGAMGAVFTGRHVNTRKTAAVKIIRPDLVADDNHIQRFIRETRAMQSIKSKYVVRFRASGQDHSVIFLAVELVNGQNLRQLLKQKKQLSVNHAVTLMAGIFEGLAAIHNAGIIHRDIKPDNILLTREGIPKITDFGLARREGGEESLAVTQTGALLGTPHYMSPEQCRGEEVDFRADLYSMGCMFFHLVSGQTPFPSRKLHEIIEQHLTADPPDPMDFGVPAPVAKIIYKLMAKDPERRPPDAATVGQQLRQLMNEGMEGALTDISDGVDETFRTLEVAPEDNDESFEDEPLPSFVQIKGMIRDSKGEIPEPPKPRRLPWRSALLALVLLITGVAFNVVIPNKENPLDAPTPASLHKILVMERDYFVDLRRRDNGLALSAELALLDLLMKDEQLATPFLNVVLYKKADRFKNAQRRVMRVLGPDKIDAILENQPLEIHQRLGDHDSRPGQRQAIRYELLYRGLPKVPGKVATFHEVYWPKEGIYAQMSLKKEAPIALQNFRWAYRKAMSRGDPMAAAQVAWQTYERYGNLHGQVSEVYLAFAEALVQAKGQRQHFSVAIQVPITGAKARFIETYKAVVGPLERPRTMIITAPLVLGLVFAAYSLLFYSLALLTNGYYFLRWGLWIQLAMIQKNSGKAAEILKKSGQIERAADLMQAEGAFVTAAEYLIEAGLPKRAAVSLERANYMDKAAEIYVEIKDYTRAGEIYLQLEEWDKAGDNFHKAGALSRAADAYSRGGQTDRAAEVLMSEGRVAAAAKLLADDLERQRTRRTPGPKPQLEAKAVRVAKLFSQAKHFREAAMYFEFAGNYGEAAEMFLEDGSLREAADNFVASGQKDRAIEILDQLGDVRNASLLYAEHCLEQGDYEGAGENFERAGDLKRAANAWETAGDYKRAARCASRMQEDSRTAELLAKAGELDKAGKIFEDNDQPLEAIRCYEAVEDFASMARVRKKLGEYVEAARNFVKAGDEAQAFDLLRQVPESDAEYYDGLALYGQILAQREGWQAAIDELREAIRGLEMDRYSAVTFRFLADAHFELGQRREARMLTDKIFRAGFEDANDRARLNQLESGRRSTTRHGIRPQGTRPPAPSGRAPGPRASGVRRPTGTYGPAGGPGGPPGSQRISKRRPTQTGRMRPAGRGPTPMSSGRRRGPRGSTSRRRRTTAHSVQNTQMSHRPPSGPRPTPPPQQSAMTGPPGPPAGADGAFEGRTIDKYKVLKPLGEGAYAWVFQAQHVMLERPVAIKILKPLGISENTNRRFLEEAKLISKIKHPNIVELYDFGRTEEGLLYMVLELLEGEDLRDYLKQHHDGSLPRSTHIIIEILKSLSAAHSHGVVHRDLKPENVYMVADGSLRVLDFGIAKVLHSDSEATANRTLEGTFLGTPRYASPEQATGDDTGPWTDIYAAALIYYEMLTGAFPFRSKTAVGFLTQHASVDPSPPSELNPDIPAEVEQAIMRALEKDPAERFQSAEEFIAAITPFAR